MDSTSSCPFCLRNDLLRVKVLFEDELWYFTGPDVSDPQKAGMAITKRHIQTPFDINKEEWERLHVLLPKFKDLISQNTEADGYNIGWNVGASGGQTVFHAHLHIVPRSKSEPLAGKGIRYFFK